MRNLTTASVRISRVMTRDLIAVSLGSSVEEAVKKMVDHDVECLPVIDSEGSLRGLLTFRDIVTKFVYTQAEPRKSKVEDIMAKDLVTCEPNSTILDVVKIMKNRHLRRIPVVNSRNMLVGLVTDFDLALVGWDFE